MKVKWVVELEISDVDYTISEILDVTTKPQVSMKMKEVPPIIEHYMHTMLRSNLEYDKVGIVITKSQSRWSLTKESEK